MLVFYFLYCNLCRQLGLHFNKAIMVDELVLLDCAIEVQPVGVLGLS